MDLKNSQKKKNQFFNHCILQNDTGSPEKKIPKSAEKSRLHAKGKYNF